MSLFSKLKETIGKTYKKIDVKLGGVLPGGVKGPSAKQVVKSITSRVARKSVGTKPPTSGKGGGGKTTRSTTSARSATKSVLQGKSALDILHEKYGLPKTKLQKVGKIPATELAEKLDKFYKETSPAMERLNFQAKQLESLNKNFEQKWKNYISGNTFKGSAAKYKEYLKDYKEYAKKFDTWSRLYEKDLEYLKRTSTKHFKDLGKKYGSEKIILDEFGIPKGVVSGKPGQKQAFALEKYIEASAIEGYEKRLEQLKKSGLKGFLEYAKRTGELDTLKTLAKKGKVSESALLTTSLAHQYFDTQVQDYLKKRGKGYGTSLSSVAGLTANVLGKKVAEMVNFGLALYSATNLSPEKVSHFKTVILSKEGRKALSKEISNMIKTGEGIIKSKAPQYVKITPFGIAPTEKTIKTVIGKTKSKISEQINLIKVSPEYVLVNLGSEILLAVATDKGLRIIGRTTKAGKARIFNKMKGVKVVETKVSAKTGKVTSMKVSKSFLDRLRKWLKIKVKSKAKKEIVKLPSKKLTGVIKKAKIKITPSIKPTKGVSKIKLKSASGEITIRATVKKGVTKLPEKVTISKSLYSMLKKIKITKTDINKLKEATKLLNKAGKGKAKRTELTKLRKLVKDLSKKRIDARKLNKISKELKKKGLKIQFDPEVYDIARIKYLASKGFLSKLKPKETLKIRSLAKFVSKKGKVVGTEVIIPQRGGTIRLKTVGSWKTIREPIKEQAKVIGKEVTAVSAQANRLLYLIKRKRVIRKPIPNEAKLSKRTKELLKKFDKGTISERELVILDKLIKKETNTGLLERSMFFDPKARIRTTRLGKTRYATLKDVLKGNFTFRSPKPQILVLKDKVPHLPKGMEKIEKKLKAGKRLTQKEIEKFNKYLVKRTGKLKPIGFLSTEPEVTLAPKEIIKKVKTLGYVKINKRYVPIVQIKVVKPKKELKRLLNKANKGKISGKELIKLEKMLKKETGFKVSLSRKATTKPVLRVPKRLPRKKPSAPAKISKKAGRKILVRTIPRPKKVVRKVPKVAREPKRPPKKKPVRLPAKRPAKRPLKSPKRPPKKPPKRPVRAPPKRPPKKPPTKPPIKIPKPGKKRRKELKKPEKIVYNVYGKYKNKYIKLNKLPLTKTDALSRGAYAIDHSTARTFKIVPVGEAKKVGRITKGEKGYFSKTKRKYRTVRISRGKRIVLKNKYIEKRKKAIDTKGEKKGLSLAKLRKKLLGAKSVARKAKIRKLVRKSRSSKKIKTKRKR